MKEIIPLKYKPYIKTLLLPLSALVVLLLMFIFGIRFLYNGVDKLRVDINESKKDQNTLHEKLSILRDAEASNLLISETALIALPSENPTLVAIQQVKSQALKYSIIIENLVVEIGPSQGEGLQKVHINLDSSGNINSVLDFLDSLKTIAPLTRVADFQVEQLDPVSAHLRTKIAIYWSPLPARLPEISQAVGSLSDEEKTVLLELAKLSKPEIVNTSATGTSSESNLTPIGRSNPFEL